MEWIGVKKRKKKIHMQCKGGNLFFLFPSSPLFSFYASPVSCHLFDSLNPSIKYGAVGRGVFRVCAPF